LCGLDLLRPDHQDDVAAPQARLLRRPLRVRFNDGHAMVAGQAQVLL
jgi:hypothetical protein